MDVKAQVTDALKSVERFAQENVVVKTAHTGLRLGLGAMALGREELEAMLKRLQEKGEIAEQDSRKLLEEWFQRGRKPVAEYEERVEKLLDQRIEAVLAMMNIPSKSDIEELGKKIAALSRKVSELDKKLSAEHKVVA
jgi:poly(hydroxyalkanoate) granule-associated protein